jgi:hypothetical protein
LRYKRGQAVDATVGAGTKPWHCPSLAPAGHTKGHIHSN